MKKYLIYLLALSFVPVFVFAQYQQADIDPEGPTSSCISLQNNLRYQSRDIYTNGEVSTLQDFLQSKGYLNSEPTGYFGLLTVAASKNFQNSNGISGDGYVGPITRAKIKAMTCNEVYVPPATTRLPAGCTSNSSYSSTTGEPCKTDTTKLPSGCTSASGYSSTTGEPCTKTVYPKPTLLLSASPMSVASGQPVTLTWSSKNTYDCGVGTGWGGKALSGNEVVYASTYSNEFSVNCVGNGGSVSKKVTIDIIDANLPVGCSSVSGFSLKTGEPCGTTPKLPIITFTATPSTLTAGESTMLRWSTTNATSCVGNTQEIAQATIEGAQLIYPNTTTTYKITCSSASGQTATKSVTVTVTPSPSFPPGCSSTYGWSTTTGLACNTPLPDGCLSYDGWSTTTGQACNGSY